MQAYQNDDEKTETENSYSNNNWEEDSKLECLTAISSSEINLMEETEIEFEERLKRVSSCFFSVRSGISSCGSSMADLRALDEEKEELVLSSENAVDVLYHDILMQVLSFLPLESLARFSETGRRANFECFYFLQLQIDKALQCSSEVKTALSRMSILDPVLAQKLANEFLDSNTSFRYTIPILQKLACLRQALYESQLALSQKASSSNMKAGLFLTVLGGACASYMTGSSSADLSNFMMDVSSSLDQNTIHAGQALLSFGLMASLGKVAKSRMHYTHQTNSNSDSSSASENILYAMDHPSSSDPYYHITNETSEELATQRSPTGCVGSFCRINRKSASALHEIIKTQRVCHFNTLSETEQTQISTNFIDACANDELLQVVKSIVTSSGINVDAFYISSDGTETCALHCAAFHGAIEVLRYLCSSFDLQDPKEDGGLCNINIQDSNGWTALHFAAGSNHVQAISILALFRADMTIEAGNGYTPYSWAERLGNKEAMKEFERLGATNRFNISKEKFARGFFNMMVSNSNQTNT